MAGHPYWASLRAGLHLAGAAGSTSFPDVRGNAFSRTGAVAISSGQQRFSGVNSAYFPGGVADLLKCAEHANFGGPANALSVAGSIYPTAYPPSGVDCRFFQAGLNGLLSSWNVVLRSDGSIMLGIPYGGTAATATGPGTVPLNGWTDFLVSMRDGIAVIWLNGVLQAWNVNQTMPMSNATRRIQLGGDDSGYSSVDARLQGYLSDVQVHIGNAMMPEPGVPWAPFEEFAAPAQALAPRPPRSARVAAVPAWKMLRAQPPSLVQDVECGGDGEVVGTTKNAGTPNYPVSRRVRLVRKRDGVLARETWSNANGDYAFRSIRRGDDYVVLSHDHTGLYNAVISDSVSAVQMGVGG